MHRKLLPSQLRLARNARYIREEGETRRDREGMGKAK